MKRKLLFILMVVLVFAWIPGIGHSDLITNTFIGVVTNGPLSGTVGTGDFTFDEDDILTGDENLVGTDIEVNFVFDGQTFDETNDELYSSFPMLVFEDFERIGLNYWLTDSINGVNFNNPLLAQLRMYDLIPSDGDFDYLLDITATYVPIPGAVWLLGSGLIGLVGLRKKFKKR